MSILPIYTAVVLIAALGLVANAQRGGHLSRWQALAAYGLWALLGVWTSTVVLLGQSQWHLAQMERVPLLWQALVPVALWATGVTLFKNLREGLVQLGRVTPAHWFVGIQALRIGAVGGISKGLSGEISSTYVYWVGIPDFVFGMSALFMIRAVAKGQVSDRVLFIWNMTGAAIILLPSFLAMPYWMAEPGFSFIFEYPMILAPSIVVSMMVSLNLLQAYSSWRRNRPHLDANPAV